MRKEAVQDNQKIKELEEVVENLRQELQSTKERVEAGRKQNEEDLRIALEHLSEEMKKKLTHSHRLMQYIIEHDRNAIAVLDRDLRYIYVSERFLSDYKLKEKNVIGKNHYDIFPDLPLGWKDVHRKALAGEILTADEDPYFRDDGSIEWIRWECRPWFELDCSIGGIILYTEVITKQKEAEIEMIMAKERAEESEGFKTEILIKLDEAQHMGKIGSWDWNVPSGNVWWSDELYNIFEVDPNEYKPSVEANASFVHPDDTEGYNKATFDALETREMLDYQLRIVTAKGKTKYCKSAAKIYFDENNKPVRMSGTFTDITEQILIQNELNAAKEKAEESDRLKTAFLQNISHEVRTPLNSIVGFSQLLSEPGQSPANIKAFSDIISASSDKLIGIITDVIEISQIQSNQVEVILTRFEITSVLSAIVDDFREAARRKNIVLSLNQNIPPDRSFIFSDISKLKKIFIHLIDNAIKFTPRGSVKVGCDIKNDNLVFSISDTGIGMTDDEQITIFEPFRQLETRLSRNSGGNGLGLAIVKAYTSRLNGTMTLRSEKKKGTSITITIPLKKELVKPEKDVTPEVRSNVTENHVSTILIVEDEYGNFRYLYELLLSENTRILHASNGEEAVEVCRNNDDIDMILMDIKMPVMDGDSAARAIKEFRPDIPIIAQTAYVMESEKLNYLNTFDDLISKPINRKELKEKIEKYMHVAI